MYFESFAEFIQMGKHGPYVWSAYGISISLVIGLVLQLRARRRQVLTMIRQQIRRDAPPPTDG